MSEEFTVITCPTCKKRLRVPTGFGTIRVSCAHCSNKFYFTSVASQVAQGVAQPDKGLPTGQAAAGSDPSHAKAAPAASPATSSHAEGAPLPAPTGEWRQPELILAWAVGIGVSLFLIDREWGIAAAAVGYFTGAAAGAVLHNLAHRVRVKAYEHQPCEHGVRGGNALPAVFVLQATEAPTRSGGGARGSGKGA